MFSEERWLVNSGSVMASNLSNDEKYSFKIGKSLLKSEAKSYFMANAYKALNASSSSLKTCNKNPAM